jgi:hypothetical protein
MNKEWPKNTMLIQNHFGIDPFDYEIAVDWALELINNGIESESIWMLASFSKPVYSLDIQPYISTVLNDLNLDEKKGEEAIFGYIHYVILQISSKTRLRENLKRLSDLYLECDEKLDLIAFYLLSHGWCELEDIGENFYYQDVGLYDIEDACLKEANLWIDEHINGINILRDKPKGPFEGECIKPELKNLKVLYWKK